MNRPHAEPSDAGSLPTTPVPTQLIERAVTLVNEHPGCFWFRHPEARIRNEGDIRLVIERLREYGDRRAWRAAQELHQCLSLHCKRTH
jgi:hypothetical protein